ncbi:tetratricopeptide repeat protein [Actinomadura rubteroloni]|uniref:tetratricopeptide repeat protein n=1 Tax=Actinomadura rubteroloni TaxID=1926885 RepID=UPI000CD95788|nr:tetratricopeptide repeat protein [Actinomadura rubteroloni]
MSSLREISNRVRNGQEPSLTVISGTGGIGKTTLSVAWLQSVRDLFSDGQLFTDLRGFSGTEPVEPDAVLTGFLRALGVGPEAIPPRIDEQAALFRSLTAGRRMIIMLDNAMSAAQVRPLLPGHGPILVVVTSRSSLPGLAIDGASYLTLGPFAEEDALDLLDRMIGTDRVSAEPDAARELAALCDGLPLALCTSASQLAARVRWPIRRIVDELSDEHRRLTTLRAEDDSVRNVFDVAYKALPPDAARMYRLLSVYPGASLPIESVAAIVGADPRSARATLDVLTEANLIEEGGDGRYRFHDLARIYSREIAQLVERHDDRDAAFRRLVDHRLAHAVAADRAVIPARWHLGGHYEETPVVEFASVEDALNALETELSDNAALIGSARAHGLHREVWQLCEAHWGLFVYRKHYAHWLATYTTGLESAAACEDPAAEALMTEGVASAHLNMRNFALAQTYAERAIVLERRAGRVVGEAAALERLGVARQGLGDPAGAVAAYRRARELHEGIGRARGVALMARHIGDALLQDGRPDEAVPALAEALAYFTAKNDDYNRARTLTALGRAHAAAGHRADADTALAEAAGLASGAGARHQEATIALARADVARDRGDARAERGHLELAAELFAALGSPELAEVRARLGPE